MTRLRLTLLGGFQARVDNDRDVVLSLKKAQALLAFLAIPAGKPHSRDQLAGLLWGEMREPQARSGLRYALFVLRRALGETSALRLEDFQPVNADVRLRTPGRKGARGGPGLGL